MYADIEAPSSPPRSRSACPRAQPRPAALRAPGDLHALSAWASSMPGRTWTSARRCWSIRGPTAWRAPRRRSRAPSPRKASRCPGDEEFNMLRAYRPGDTPQADRVEGARARAGPAHQGVQRHGLRASSGSTGRMPARPDVEARLSILAIGSSQAERLRPELRPAHSRARRSRRAAARRTARAASRPSRSSRRPDEKRPSRRPRSTCAT